jgi:hypothetical protein
MTRCCTSIFLLAFSSFANERHYIYAGYSKQHRVNPCIWIGIIPGRMSHVPSREDANPKRNNGKDHTNSQEHDLVFVHHHPPRGSVRQKQQDLVIASLTRSSSGGVFIGPARIEYNGNLSHSSIQTGRPSACSLIWPPSLAGSESVYSFRSPAFHIPLPHHPRVLGAALWPDTQAFRRRRKSVIRASTTSSIPLPLRALREVRPQFPRSKILSSAAVRTRQLGFNGWHAIP